MNTLRLWVVCLGVLWTMTASGDEDWPTATPEEVGMNPAPLTQMLAELPAPKKHGLHRLLVVRQGRLVLEEYWRGHRRETVHDLRSATKSITSLLLGIAIAQGKVSGVSDPLLPYLAKAYPDLRGASEKKDLRLSHLLTMSSGLDCDDRDRSTRGQEDRMYRRRDWVRHFLELEVVHPPGEVSRYCTGGVVALGRVIAEASGLPIPEFARRHLFGPLGVRGERWSLFDKDRQTDTGGHLYLRPVDLVKIGQLVLQDGCWAGSRWFRRAGLRSPLNFRPGCKTHDLVWLRAPSIMRYFHHSSHHEADTLIEKQRRNTISPDYIRSQEMAL